MILFQLIIRIVYAIVSPLLKNYEVRYLLKSCLFLHGYQSSAKLHLAQLGYSKRIFIYCFKNMDECFFFK